MIENSAASGEGISFAKFPDIYGDKAMISAIEEGISTADGPSAAFRLMDQKRLLEDRMRFRSWLEQSRAFSTTQAEPTANHEATSRLLRRSTWSITR